MKSIYLILFCSLLIASISKGQSSKPSTLLAGVARVDITPKVPIPIAWHAGANKVYDGIHDSVFIRAVVFSDGKSKADLIAADGSEFSSAFDDEMFARIEKETG